LVRNEEFTLKEKLKNIEVYLRYFLSYLINYPLIHPKEINFQMTNACNLHCKMCNIWKLPRKKEKEIDIEEMKRILDEVKNWKNTKYVSFVGGEALIRVKDTLELIRYAKSLGFFTNLVSNGTFLTEKETCRKLLKAGLDRIALSLDGAKRETHDFIRGKGNYEQVLRATKNFLSLKKDFNIKVDLTTVIMSYNFKELPEIYYLAKKLGVDQWFLQSVVLDNTFKNFDYDSEIWINDKDLKELEKVMKKLILLKLKDSRFIYNSIEYLKAVPKYFSLKEKFNLGKCMAGYFSLNIDPYGVISICSYGPNINVIGKNMDNVWENRKYRLTRIRIKKCKMPCMMLCYQRFSLLELFKIFVKG
jgi:MoaA/NifB/PqqE/SkfB family radical SAM enzyme